MEMLDATIRTFQSGRPKEAVEQLVGLVNKLKRTAPEELNSAHFDVLAQFKAYLGDAEGASEAYSEGVQLLKQQMSEEREKKKEAKEKSQGESTESDNNTVNNDNNDDNNDRFEQLRRQFIGLNLKLAKLAHRQGKEGSGVTHKKNSVCYGPKKTQTEEEEEAWKMERLNTAAKAYRDAIDSTNDDEAEPRETFRTQLAAVYFDMKDFDSAVKIYDDAFAVSKLTTETYIDITSMKPITLSTIC